jgi:hypothetical protein
MKILLLLNNAPEQPPLVGTFRRLFAPSSTSLMLLLDQLIIAIFKTYCSRKTLAKLIQAIDGENKPTVKEVWKG